MISFYINVKRKMSSIDWDKVDTVFLDSSDYLKENSIEKTYVDDEINPDEYSDYLEEVSRMIFKFIPTSYKYETKCIETMGEDNTPVLIKKWETEDAKLWMYISNSVDKDGYSTHEGYAIVYGDDENFAIIGNNNCHPFVITPKFEFYNSDGSTYENEYLPRYSTNDVKELFQEKLKEYLFDQQH